MLTFLTTTFSFFDLSPADLATTTGYIGEIFTDAQVLIFLAIGIPLAFFVIRKVIKLLPRG